METADILEIPETESNCLDSKSNRAKQNTLKLIDKNEKQAKMKAVKQSMSKVTVNEGCEREWFF